MLAVSMDLPNLDISYKWNHVICDLLCLASFIKQILLRFIHIAPCGFLFGSKIFCCMYMPQFVYPFIDWWTLELSHLLPIVTSAAINMHAHVLDWVLVFSYAVCISRSRTVESDDNSAFENSEELPNYFPQKWLNHFTFRLELYEGSNFSISSSTLIFLSFKL